MGAQLDSGTAAPAAGGGTAPETIAVALGRRVEIVGDLLLPSEPSASSRAACTDVARRLEEWEGPGILVLCGRLVAPECAEEPGSAGVVDRHSELTDALRAFSNRADSQVVAVMAPADRDPALVSSLEDCGVDVCSGVDLVCETGAGTRTVLVRAGTQQADSAAPSDTTPSEDRPWLSGMERLEDPRLARQFVTSRLLYRRLRRFLWVPPLVLAAIALLLRVDFVIDGLGRVFRSERQQAALNRAYAATWFSRIIITVVVAAVILLVLAVVVALTSRGIWRALGGGGLPRPWAGGTSGTRPVAHDQLEVDGVEALDATRAAVEAGVSGMVVGGALVPELTQRGHG